MQRLADDLVGDVRAVTVTRVDMVDAAFRPPCAAPRSRPRSLGGPNTDNFRDALIAIGELLYDKGRAALSKPSLTALKLP